MSLIHLLALNGAVTFVLMLLIWLASVRLRDVSIVDLYWGLGFVVVAWLTCILTGPLTGRKALLVALTTIWGLRLSAYLAWRKRGTAEDHRYRAMRDSIGPSFWWVSLIVVFWLQGLILCVVALPVVAGQLERSPLGYIAAVGVGLWTIGLVFESVGDYQLARFKADPNQQGKVMDRGLWRYTRHPNYFGDFLVWWGIYFVALSQTTWWTAIGPLTMSFLLVRVSGVSLLERSLAHSKLGYAEYMARTSAFIPWPPRS